jgi:small neutral amino acid transporter SnatA (MarC family)
MDQLLSSIHWVSFGLGFAAAAFLIWVLLTISAWFKKMVKPPSDGKPFGQRLRAAFRNLIAALLVLAALAVIGYIVYTGWIKP